MVIEHPSSSSSSSNNNKLQPMLQMTVQSLQWTYSLFWQFCPQQGILVWGDGYYNGEIKTRKTVQPVEVSTEEASLQRSQQLRELYDSLLAGETNQPPARRPCASLSPEDLTESEWFYFMCVSFSFPPGVGLPEKAFERQQPVWLTHANEVESKVFSRAILAKSAGIQTVVCIPLTHGVLELGSTEEVEEDMELIQHAKSLFTDNDHQPKPALSEHSASNSVARSDHHLYQYQTLSAVTQPGITNLQESNPELENQFVDDSDSDGDGENNDDNDDEDDEIEVEADSDAEIRANNTQISTQHVNSPALAVAPTSEPCERMQTEMSEGIRFGSPDDCSNNLDNELKLLMVGHNNSGEKSDHLHDHGDSYRGWHLLHEDICIGFPDSSDTTLVQELSIEDAHYSETVATVLKSNSNRWSGTNILCHSAPDQSRRSAFDKWSDEDHTNFSMLFKGTSSQWLLKNILYTIPTLHYKDKSEKSSLGLKDGDQGGNRFRKGTPQEELSANHVLAERRRREKLNERFIILRSLVPFVTKMVKASVLGDTIEYVKQLRRRIQELESQNKKLEEKSQMNFASDRASRNKVSLQEKRKLRAVGYGKDQTPSKLTAKAAEALNKSVQVSIIEADALLELQCSYRDGLLLQVMQTLDQLQLEITSIQSSSANGVFVAEVRAKVKDIDRKKTNIVEVKKAIYQIFSE